MNDQQPQQRRPAGNAAGPNFPHMPLREFRRDDITALASAPNNFVYLVQFCILPNDSPVKRIFHFLHHALTDGQYEPGRSRTGIRPLTIHSSILSFIWTFSV